MYTQELTTEQLLAMPDEEIDLSDIPEADEHFWQDAEIRVPESKQFVPIWIDKEVLKWFANSGKSYQSQINAVLKAYIDREKAVKMAA